jgi:hypothetical protein
LAIKRIVCELTREHCDSECVLSFNSDCKLAPYP